MAGRGLSVDSGFLEETPQGPSPPEAQEREDADPRGPAGLGARRLTLGSSSGAHAAGRTRF